MKGEKEIMKKFGNFVVRARYWFFGLFLLLAVAGIVLTQFVGTNYNMVEYLPDNSKTKIGIKVMEDEFGSAGTASVMISGVTKEQANELVKVVAQVEGVASAVFDDTNTSYYNEDNQKALIKIFLNNSDYSIEAEDTLNRIETALEGATYDMSGSAVDAIHSRNAAHSEMTLILLVAIAIVIAILFLTSNSYIEPVIFLIVIGVAIIINMGTNIFLGSISFVTQSISSVMLIALEMDYSIVLLHRFREEKKKVGDSFLAMEKAINGSFMAVVSSSLTVMAGLVALMFMEFSIGFDIGMVLAKGVFISVLAVIFFMPAVILMFDKLIERTSHKSFLPNMKKVGTFAKKSRFVMPILFLCVVVAAICLQSNITFSYVVTTGADDSAVVKAEREVEKYFGKQNPLVVMMAKEDIEGQKRIANYIINYTDENGKVIVNSQSTLALSSAYEELSASEIVAMGLTETTAQNIFASLNKDVSSDKVYKIEVVNYLLENNTVLATDFATTINGYYNQLFAELDKATAKAMYGLTDEQVSAVFGENEKVYNIVLINFVVEYSLPAGQTSEVLIAHGKANAVISVADLKDKYSLTDEQIATLYTLMGKNVETDSIKYYEMVKVLHDNQTLAGMVVTNMQNTFVSAKETFDNASSMLVGDKLSRMIFNINLATDDETALAFMNDLEKELNAVCGEEASYIVSNSYNVIGMSEVFDSDKTRTDLITIIAILIIVMCAFRSLSIPILLVLSIQGAIWINLAINVVGGSSVFFVCYLLAMAIQMGATIDYGILLTDRYVFARRKQDKFEAIKTAIDKSFVTVITSGSILVLAAFCIHFLSSIPLIADIGLLIGRGALISIITILFVLPQLLLVFDKVIEKTTLHTKFLPNRPQLATAGVSANAGDVVVSGKEVSSENVDNASEKLASAGDEIEQVEKTQNEILSKQEMALKDLSEIDIDGDESVENKRSGEKCIDNANNKKASKSNNNAKAKGNKSIKIKSKRK